MALLRDLARRSTTVSEENETLIHLFALSLGIVRQTFRHSRDENAGLGGRLGLGWIDYCLSAEKRRY